MKRLMPQLWFKIICVVLLIIFTVSSAAAVVGTAYLASENAFFDNGALLKAHTLEGSVFWNRMQRAEQYCEEYISARLNGEEFNDYGGYESYFAPEKSNFFFTARDDNGNVILSNYYEDDYRYRAEGKYGVRHDDTYTEETRYFSSLEEYEAYLAMLEENYVVTTNGYEVYENETIDAQPTPEPTPVPTTEPTETPAELPAEGAEAVTDETPATPGMMIGATFGYYTNVTRYTLTGYIRSDLTADDGIKLCSDALDKLVEMRYVIIVVGIISLAATLALFIILLCSAGHKEGVEGIHLNWIDRIPLDLYLTMLVLLLVLVAQMGEMASGGVSTAIYAVFASLSAALLLLSGIMTFASRAKAGSWWRNTITFIVLRFFWRIVKRVWRALLYVFGSLHLFWKVGIVWVVISFIEFLAIASCSGELLLWWFLEKIVFTAIIILAVINMQKLKQGGEKMASGELDFAVDTEHMLPMFAGHAKNLNSIATGMQRAVDQQMKSERLKTELITNVSHDIKTPLTSIINYVDLLKKEDVKPDAAKEYIEVLDRQSARLKKLTEDLVEASKASTGNIKVNMGRTDVNILLSQAVAEYDEKLAEKHLELVMSSAQGDPCIYADGRLLWRVFDNLMGNICKYALDGTRVYIAAKLIDGEVFITFKNISKFALNISSQELMERFVRGDASRSTEGSGLGLSIARSLVELQKGSFSIDIDGDLFKAIVSFKEDKSPEAE